MLSQLVLLVWLLTQTVLSPQLTLHLSSLPVPITWPLKVLLTPLLPQSSLTDQLQLLLPQPSLPQPSLPQSQPLPQSQLTNQLLLLPVLITWPLRDLSDGNPSTKASLSKNLYFKLLSYQYYKLFYSSVIFASFVDYVNAL